MKSLRLCRACIVVPIFKDNPFRDYIIWIMTVQVEGFFDLHRFLFSVKGGLYMPEQSVYHQKETVADQQTIIQKTEGDIYENNRQGCAGRIQRRHRT